MITIAVADMTIDVHTDADRRRRTTDVAIDRRTTIDVGVRRAVDTVDRDHAATADTIDDEARRHVVAVARVPLFRRHAAAAVARVHPPQVRLAASRVPLRRRRRRTPMSRASIARVRLLSTRARQTEMVTMVSRAPTSTALTTDSRRVAIHAHAADERKVDRPHAGRRKKRLTYLSSDGVADAVFVCVCVCGFVRAWVWLSMCVGVFSLPFAADEHKVDNTPAEEKVTHELVFWWHDGCHLCGCGCGFVPAWVWMGVCTTWVWLST